MPRPKLLRKDYEWNENLAYAVGLITTDGYLSNDKRHISYTSTDIDLISTLQRCLGKNNKISLNPPSKISKKIAYRVQFGDVVLYDWLTKIGLHTNKSLNIGELLIEDKYFPDFLRGHLDGDGSIIFYKDKYNTNVNPKYIYDRLFVYFLSSSEYHIKWLRKRIYSLKGIRGSLSTNKPKTQKGSSVSYKIKFSTKEAKIILKWIYYKEGLPCLRRKYLIAQPFL